MPLKFHLDEHVPRAVAEGLRRRGIDVTTTVDAGLMGADDLTHIEFARREGRVIYTQDEDSLILSSERVEHRGVVYNHSEARTIRQIIECLTLIAGVMTEQEMVNHMEFC
jgi:predicted nuclease of predicted toxin-antitoxin system